MCLGSTFILHVHTITLKLPYSLKQVEKLLIKYRKCCCREKRLTPAVFVFHRLLHEGTFYHFCITMEKNELLAGTFNTRQFNTV